MTTNEEKQLGRAKNALLSFRRVGLLHISEREPNVFPVVGARELPERFRAKIAKLADEYVQQHEADWKIRA